MCICGELPVLLYNKYIALPAFHSQDDPFLQRASFNKIIIYYTTPTTHTSKNNIKVVVVDDEFCYDALVVSFYVLHLPIACPRNISYTVLWYLWSVRASVCTLLLFLRKSYCVSIFHSRNSTFNLFLPFWLLFAYPDDEMLIKITTFCIFYTQDIFDYNNLEHEKLISQKDEYLLTIKTELIICFFSRRKQTNHWKGNEIDHIKTSLVVNV